MGKIISVIEHSSGDTDSLQLVNAVLVQLTATHLAVLTKRFTPQLGPLQLQSLTKDVSLFLEVKLSAPTALATATAELDAANLSKFVLVGDCPLDHFQPATKPQLPFPTTAVLDNCSLCLLRPRMLREKHVGELVDAIQRAGFEISALKLLHLTTRDADEFFGVYKGIYRQYHEVIKYMTSAPCIAVEVRGDDAVRTFRELCGPHDVQVARVLRPTSLRARFGTTNLYNAVHCTDCPEDGVLEVQFFFTTLS
jgi:nucleoside diphosphate kinase